LHRYSKDKKVYNWILILIQCCLKIVKRFLTNGISCIYFNDNWINSTTILIAFNSLSKSPQCLIILHSKKFWNDSCLICLKLCWLNLNFHYLITILLNIKWNFGLMLYLNRNHCFIDEYCFISTSKVFLFFLNVIFQLIIWFLFRDYWSLSRKKKNNFSISYYCTQIITIVKVLSNISHAAFT